MADNTKLNGVSVVGGDNIATEDIGGAYKIPVSKIRTGASDVDGGDVTASNPLFVQLSNGATPIGSSGAPVPVTMPGGVTANVGTTGGLALDATVSARLGTLGQKPMAGSTPVVLASDQPALPVTLPGAVTANVGTTGGLALDSTISARLGTVGQKAMVASTPVAIASDQSAVPVSAASLPLPTGAALDATIAARLGTVGQKAMAASTPVVIASDQSALPVSGTVTVVDSVPLPVVGAGGALALDATVTGRLGTLGQKAMSGSTPVALASDQSALPVTAASLPLPTGAALDATIAARLGTVGQKTMTASTPVVLASDQSAVPISAASLPLPAGAALDATLTARLGTVGQKTMSASTPVAIASDQSAVPVSGTVTATVTGVALDATLTGGTAKAQVVDAAGHVQPAGDVVARAIQVDDTAGDLASSWVDAVAAASGVIKASAGTFIELDAANNGAVTLYLQLFNSATVPADTAVPSLFFPIGLAAGEKVSLRAPRAFSTGLSWCASSTAATKTIAAGTPFGVSVEYR